MAVFVSGGDIFGSFPTDSKRQKAATSEADDVDEEISLGNESSEPISSKYRSSLRISTTNLAFSCITSALTIFSIVLGSTTLGKCPAEPRIPLYLVIGGVLGLVNFAFRIICEILGNKQANSSTKHGRAISIVVYCLDAAFVLGFVAVAVSGIFLVFGLNPNFDEDTGGERYCNKLTYHFAFALSSIFFLASLFAIVTGLVGYLSVWAKR